MSKDALAKVVQRAISDAAFRRQLNSDPTGALRGFDLSTDELSALRTGDAGRLSTLGIDQRMSKAFAIGGGLASTRMSQSDLTPGGGPSMVDDASGASAKTVIPADPTRPGGSADLDGGISGTSTVRAGDDYKFAGRVAPEGGSSVRTGDDWKFTDRVAADTGNTVRTGDDWKFADRASQGAVAPVEGSPEATALENKASGGMANYPAHDGLAGPSGASSVRAGDDWARNSAGIADSGRIGSARLDDASGAADKASVIHDDPNGFLAANADAGGSVVRANVIHDDPNGFLAANADATGGADMPTTAFIDESESYLTKVGYDATADSASGGATAIHDDPDGFLAANQDASGADSATPTTDAEGGPHITP
ncbi:MAG TPA: Os1348 family NHLP clan protein [Candidatus Limnocylindria bacterium]